MIDIALLNMDNGYGDGARLPFNFAFLRDFWVCVFVFLVLASASC